MCRFKDPGHIYFFTLLVLSGMILFYLEIIRRHRPKKILSLIKYICTGKIRRKCTTHVIVNFAIDENSHVDKPLFISFSSNIAKLDIPKTSYIFIAPSPTSFRKNYSLKCRQRQKIHHIDHLLMIGPRQKNLTNNI